MFDWDKSRIAWKFIFLALPRVGWAGSGSAGQCLRVPVLPWRSLISGNQCWTPNPRYVRPGRRRDWGGQWRGEGFYLNSVSASVPGHLPGEWTPHAVALRRAVPAPLRGSFPRAAFSHWTRHDSRCWCDLGCSAQRVQFKLCSNLISQLLFQGRNMVF